MDNDETQANAQQQPGAEEVASLQKAYEKHLEKARADHGQKLDRQLKDLEKLSKKYEKQARKGADEAGLDIEAMRADFKSAAQGDPDGALSRFQAAQTTWAPKLAKAIAATGVDPKQGSQEAKAVLGEDVPADLPDTGSDGMGLVGYSAKIASTAPSAAEEAQPRLITSTLTIPKPYTLGSTKSGATANRNTGRLFSDNHVDFGIQQQLASVGGTFYADAAVRRIRVETIVDATFFNVVGAAIGYSSAEVILNLKVLDGATLRGSQRLSLLRTIAAVFWVSSDSGSGAYTLACEFDHAYGTPKTYAALVELETWAGGGGLFVWSAATAYGDATPRNVTVRLMR